MKERLKLISLLLTFLLILPTLSLAGQFKITRVYNGDTIKAQGHDIEIKVILVVIDAPGLDLEPHWQAEKEAREAKKGMWSLGDN